MQARQRLWQKGSLKPGEGARKNAYRVACLSSEIPQLFWNLVSTSYICVLLEKIFNIPIRLLISGHYHVHLYHSNVVESGMAAHYGSLHPVGWICFVEPILPRDCSYETWVGTMTMIALRIAFH